MAWMMSHLGRRVSFGNSGQGLEIMLWIVATTELIVALDSNDWERMIKEDAQEMKECSDRQ
jgi:hypothetical protein